jgi:CheY-like chemotaxis protein
MRRIVENLGHAVIATTDGHEALQLLARRRFDLVLMDIQMPGIDGLETTRRVRAGAEGVLDPHVPIIGVTAHALKGDEEICRSAGMNDYVSKPIRRGELAEKIARQLGEPALSPAPLV